MSKNSNQDWVKPKQSGGDTNKDGITLEGLLKKKDGLTMVPVVSQTHANSFADLTLALGTFFDKYNEYDKMFKARSDALKLGWNQGPVGDVIKNFRGMTALVKPGVDYEQTKEMFLQCKKAAWDANHARLRKCMETQVPGLVSARIPASVVKADFDKLAADVEKTRESIVNGKPAWSDKAHVVNLFSGSKL